VPLETVVGAHSPMLACGGTIRAGAADGGWWRAILAEGSAGGRWKVPEGKGLTAGFDFMVSAGNPFSGHVVVRSTDQADDRQ